MKSIYDYILESNSDLEQYLTAFLKSSKSVFEISEDDADPQLCDEYKIRELIIKKTTGYDELKDVDTKNSTIYLVDIIMAAKGSGQGTQVMEIIGNAAKKCKYDIALHPDDMFGSELKRLTKFYEKLGYRPSQKAIQQNIKKPGQNYIMFKYS